MAVVISSIGNNLVSRYSAIALVHAQIPDFFVLIVSINDKLLIEVGDLFPSPEFLP